MGGLNPGTASGVRGGWDGFRGWSLRYSAALHYFIGPLVSWHVCEAADDSPSPGGEGRGEGGRNLFQQELYIFQNQSLA